MTETGGRSWRQTTYYPFLHASRYGRGTVLNTVVKSDSYEADFESVTYKIPYLDSVAVINGNDLTIFAINKYLDADMNFECELRGFGDFEVVEHIVMHSPDIKAKNTADKPDNVKPEIKGDAAVRSSRLKATLTRLSWNVIRLKLK